MEKALRLPPNVITDDHRQRYKSFCENNKVHAAPGEQQRRMVELDMEFRNAAFGYIDSTMCQFSDGLGEKRDVAVRYTVGAHIRSVGILAALWTEMRTAIAFNREERLKLEQRITELESRPLVPGRASGNRKSNSPATRSVVTKARCGLLRWIRKASGQELVMGFGVFALRRAVMEGMQQDDIR